MNRILTIFAVLVITIPAFCQEKSIVFSEEEKQWIKDHPIVQFGYEPNWPPYEIYKNEKYQGIVGDLINKLSQETGIKFQPIPYISWNQSLEKLGTGEINVVACMGITPDRENKFLITDPYFTDPLVIATRKDFKTVDYVPDLKGHKVALPESYYTLDLITKDYPELEVITYASIKECIAAVSLGKADAFIGSLGVISYYINNHGFSNIKVSASTPYLDSRFGLAVTKDWPELHRIAQKVFDNMSVKEISEIRSKWISVQYEHTTNNAKLIRRTLTILIPSLLVFIIFVFWTKKLKSEISKRKKVEQDLEASLQKIKIQNDEKSVLLKEIHHRVKNNLQVITSILRLQANSSTNEKVEESLKEASERIQSISLIHNMIYNTENLASVKIESYINKLTAEIATSFGTGIGTKIEVDPGLKELSVKSLVPIALIFNELITNSIKYAFAEKETGLIEIHIGTKDDLLQITYQDHGLWVNPSENHSGFGLSLIEVFTEQLDGTFTLDKTQGSKYTFLLKPFQ